MIDFISYICVIDLQLAVKPRLLQRALSVLRSNRSPPPSTSVLSSVVGFFAAHATILAATVIGRLKLMCTYSQDRVIICPKLDMSY